MTARNTGGTARWEEGIWSSRFLMERSNINRDTYLNCWCPSCGEGLNKDGNAVFRIVNQNGEEGIRLASPYLNVLGRECFLQIDDGLDNVYCPHCNSPLVVPHQTCEQNECRIAKIHVSVQDSIRLSLLFCTDRSCRWYNMSEEDNERLILRESHEW